MYPYMPHFIDQNGHTWNVNVIHFVIGAAGRSLEIECSCPELQGLKFFTYRYLTNTFVQYDPEEVIHSIPQPGPFWDACHTMFNLFDHRKLCNE